MKESRDHSVEVYISLLNLSVHRTGQYQCSYSNAHHPKQHSDNLTLMLTGLSSTPLLKAHLSPVVASGENVSLSCSTLTMMDTFHLLKKGDADPQQLEP